jgi:SAM-dependent methyltransferase
MDLLFTLNKIEPLFKKLDKVHELEVMFNNYKRDNKLSIEDFIRVTKMLKLQSQKDKKSLKQNISLDIIYQQNNLTKYRLSVNGREKINKLVNLVIKRSNNVILTVLLSKYDKSFMDLIKKTRLPKECFDQDSLDIRFRKSLEEDVSKKEFDKISNLSSDHSNNICFRYKNRINYLVPFSAGQICFDLSIIQSNTDLKKLATSAKEYEIEMEILPKKTIDKKALNEILEKVIEVKKVLSQNVHLTSTISNDKVLENYKELVFKDKKVFKTHLFSMQPISAEVQHLVDKIPNSYSATDKADGTKNAIFITNNEVFLIDNNLNVKPTGIKVKNMDNTLLEGELIFLPKKQVFLMMIFDILYYKSTNVMSTINIRERLTKMFETVNEITNNKETFVEDYSGDFDLSKMRKHYEKEMITFYKDVDTKINKAKKGDIIIKPKLFLFPTGGSPSEIFMFSDLIWESCTENDKVLCPYELDGIIFTGLNQKYTVNKNEWKYPIYKFKPPSQNSLDVYLVFPRNTDTGEFMEIFDKSDTTKVSSSSYRIANFYVGDTLGDKEVPVEFMKEHNNHEAYFEVIDGQVRDISGDVIQDKTVIEITYNNNPDIPHNYRWNILRTRWDKTESVNRHNKRYGNFRDVAIKTWKSMKEAVTWDEIKALANPDSYSVQMKQLQGRIDTTIISSDRQQDAYYQKVSNLCKPMRGFHNWIKSVIIYTHCAKKRFLRETKETKMNVLDIGCGRGGDILKMYHPRVGYYVGIDANYDGIHSANDGAIARYKIFKGKFPDFPKMEFVQADAGVEFNGEKQKNKLGNMKMDNITNMDRIFKNDKKKSFDLVNSMFAFHYLFSDDSTLEGACKNINDYLKPGGLLIFTMFDGERVNELLESSKDNKFTSYYTDEEGKRTKLFELVKKYKLDSKGDMNKTGLALDVHMSWVSEEGTYETEYLVSKDFMVKTMKEKCNANLIETDLFENMYNLNRPYFDVITKVEENEKNRKFYQDVAQFYGDLKGADKESKKYSFLFRYYVFQKKY